MRRFAIHAAVSLLVCLILTGCETTTTVIAPEGTKAAELGKAKDQQVADMAQQIVDIKAQRAKEQAEAAKAASSLKGILKANEYQAAGKPTEAVKEEASVGLTRLPADDPAETVKSIGRVIELIQGQRDKALADFAVARHEGDEAKKTIAAKDGEIAARDKTIQDRDGTIVQLGKDATAEKAAAVKTLQKVIDNKNAEIQHVKDEAAAKERAAWVLWTRIAGLGLIVIGVVLLAVFKLVTEGAGLAAGGVLIGLISIFIDWLTSRPWFPWLCGTILLGVLAAGGYAIYHMWRTQTLHTKLTAALQDLKDESTTLGQDTWSKVAEHLDYRLGTKWGKAQTNQVAALGLINPAAEPPKDAPK